MMNATGDAPSKRQRTKRGVSRTKLIGWLGLLPFAVFMTLFLVIPVLFNFWRSLHDSSRAWSLQPLQGIFAPEYLTAYVNTIKLSLVTALLGGLLGLLLAWALCTATKPRWLAKIMLSFSAVASQLGGVPLAFAFIALMGTEGVLTVAIRNVSGVDISKFLDLSSFWGLTVVYLYFQIPLMAVLIMPPILGLKKEWSESSAALGASPLQTLMRVTIPVLAPAIIGTMLLLFANAFAAYATAYALSGGSANLIAIMVGVFLTGNVFVDENFGAALIVGMIAIILVAFIMRSVLERRTAKWLQ